MKNIHACAVVAVLLGAVACGGKGGNGGAYKELQQAINAGDDFAASAAKVEAKLGPANLKDESAWHWATVDGDYCFDLDLLKNGDKVAGVGGGKVNKMVEEPFAKCKAVAATKPAS